MKKSYKLYNLVFFSIILGLSMIVIKSNAQFPDFPPDDVTRTMDRDQMMWQLGISFPELPPKLEDPNRPDSAWPSNASNPEVNWTDAYGMYLVICVNLTHKIHIE